MRSLESHCKPRLQKLIRAFCSASTIPDTASGIPHDLNQFSLRQDFGSKLKLSEKSWHHGKRNKERSLCLVDKSWKISSTNHMGWSNDQLACCVFYTETLDVYHIVSLTLAPKVPFSRLCETQARTMLRAVYDAANVWMPSELAQHASDGWHHGEKRHKTVVRLPPWAMPSLELSERQVLLLVLSRGGGGKCSSGWEQVEIHKRQHGSAAKTGLANKRGGNAWNQQADREGVRHDALPQME